MSSVTQSGAYSEGNDSGIDMDKLFSHPDSLPSARYLVSNLIKTIHQMKETGRSAQPTQEQLEIYYSGDITGMDPEMPSVLKEVFAFRDPEPQTDAKYLISNGTIKFHERNHEAFDESHVRLTPTFMIHEPPNLHRHSSQGSVETISFNDRHNRPTYLSHMSSTSLREPSDSPQICGSSSSDGDSLFGEEMEDDFPTQPKLPSISQLNSYQQHSLSSSISHEDRNRLPDIQEKFSNSKSSYQFSNSQSQLRPQIAPGRNLLARPPNQAFPHGLPSFNGLSSLNLLPNNSNLSVTYSPIQPYPQFANNQGRPQFAIRPFTPVQPQPYHASIRSYTPIQPRIPEFDPSYYTTISTHGKMLSTKRKNKSAGNETVKRQKTEKGAKPKRELKPKVEKKESAKYKLDQDIWMRILEFTPPSFLGKARLISKTIKGFVDGFNSIYTNCRKENFGHDMPPPPPGMTEKQYTQLLGGKGCVNPGCTDKNAARTHWSWGKRWCMACWKSKIEREDRVIKSRAQEWGRTLLGQMLECIPVGMHDSFMKPHDIMDDEIDDRGRNAPRLYRYFLREDVEMIISEYEKLTPTTPVDDPTQTAEEKAAALASYQAKVAALDETRKAFFAERKAKNDEHMAHVKKIEAGIRGRRTTNAVPYNNNRQGRKDLFTKRAEEEIGHIPTEFVQRTKAFKAAVRIFRDAGTERGWQTLKPKIVKEWEVSKATEAEAEAMGVANSAEGDAATPATTGPDTDADEEMPDSDDEEEEYNIQAAPVITSAESQTVHMQPFNNAGQPQPSQSSQPSQQMQQDQQGPRHTSAIYGQSSQSAPIMSVQFPRSTPSSFQPISRPHSGLTSFTGMGRNMSTSFGLPVHQRQHIYFGNSSGNMSINPAFGHLQRPYTQSYQFGSPSMNNPSMNVNNYSQHTTPSTNMNYPPMSFNPPQSTAASTKMAISSLIQQDETMEDYDF